MDPTFINEANTVICDCNVTPCQLPIECLGKDLAVPLIIVFTLAIVVIAILVTRDKGRRRS